MKRTILIAACGLLGILFVFLVEGAVESLFYHGGQQYEAGSDERGEHQLKALLIGGPLFLAIGAWVGNTLIGNKKRAAWMAVGILLATLLCFGVPGLHGPGAAIFSYSGSSVGLVGWAAGSACMAWLLQRVTQRSA